MATASAAMGRKANNGTAESCGQVRRFLRHDETIISVCKAIFPVKAALNVADLTGYPLRTVEYWFAGGRIPADALAILIRSDYGARFIAALMADARPLWWRKLRSYFSALEALRAQKIAQKKLQDAIDEGAELNAAIGRADSLLVHDEDFYSPHLDAQRAVAGLPHRAMAAASKGGRR